MSMTKPTSEQVTFLASGSGAAQRTALDKFRDTVSVKDFGAKGDNVADDTAAIQAAVNAAMASQSGVYFPAGDYRISSTIYVPQTNIGNAIFGDGSSRLVWAGANTINVEMIRVYNAVLLKIRDLRFSGPSQITFINFRSSPIEHPRPDGRGSTKATVSDCEFRGGRIQVRFTCKDRDFNNDLPTIINCSFLEYTFAGISFEHSNCLWQSVIDCSFGSVPASATPIFAINTVDDQGGNEYDPGYVGFGADPGYGGSGTLVFQCKFGGQQHWIRLGAMRYPVEVNGCFSEGTNGIVYVPTNRLPFTATVTSGNTTVTNVTNVQQLQPNDYFWNRYVNAGTKIVSVDVPNSSIVISAAPTASQSSSVCDAGHYTAPDGTFNLAIRQCYGSLAATSSRVNQLVAVDAAGTRDPFNVSFVDNNFTTSNTIPMFVCAVNAQKGVLSLINNTGERLQVSVDNCFVSAAGFMSGQAFLSETCLLNASGAQNWWSAPVACNVSGSVMLTQQSALSATDFGIPSGTHRSQISSVPTTPTNITKISGIPTNEVRTITFNGNAALVHGSALVLRGGINATPPSGGTMAFIGRGDAGATELWRDWDNYSAASVASAANIAAIANAVNTTGKFTGKLVWDSTNNRLMRARGAADNSVWDVIDGSASVTPS
jgi:hypothetical protein